MTFKIGMGRLKYFSRESGDRAGIAVRMWLCDGANSVTGRITQGMVRPFQATQTPAGSAPGATRTMAYVSSGGRPAQAPTRRCNP
jgi:hypothetical protein